MDRRLVDSPVERGGHGYNQERQYTSKSAQVTRLISL